MGSIERVLRKVARTPGNQEQTTPVGRTGYLGFVLGDGLNQRLLHSRGIEIATTKLTRQGSLDIQAGNFSAWQIPLL
jgi:hypothetical protein